MERGTSSNQVPGRRGEEQPKGMSSTGTVHEREVSEDLERQQLLGPLEIGG